mgnify:CR=1 FL=1
MREETRKGTDELLVLWRAERERDAGLGALAAALLGLDAAYEARLVPVDGHGASCERAEDDDEGRVRRKLMRRVEGEGGRGTCG